MPGAVDRILAANREFVDRFPGEAEVRPVRKLAVVACMDARLDVAAALGLRPGETHIIRNAGGIVTDDVIRSLCLSQRVLGTESIVLVHHTDCGLQGISDDEFASRLRSETGTAPEWRAGGFAEVDGAVQASMRRLEESLFLAHRDDVIGFVYHTDTGHLRRIEPVG